MEKRKKERGEKFDVYGVQLVVSGGAKCDPTEALFSSRGSMWVMGTLEPQVNVLFFGANGLDRKNAHSFSS